jgi:hypothetical protein
MRWPGSSAAAQPCGGRETADGEGELAVPHVLEVSHSTSNGVSPGILLGENKKRIN